LLQAAEELVNELQKKTAQLVTDNAEALRKLDDLDKVWHLSINQSILSNRASAIPRARVFDPAPVAAVPRCALES
jgi:hypothetical protein